MICSFCELEAVSGVDTVERDEYYAVCHEDLARLVSEHSMVAVELVVYEDYWEDCECGCR
jgi:hypothetical protein